MNFNVMCSDSGRAHLASGAKPGTPSRKREMRSRTSESRSIPMKIRIVGSCGDGSRGRSPVSTDYLPLQQRPADHLQRLLSGKLTNVFPITGKITFDYLGPFFSCKRNVDEA